MVQPDKLADVTTSIEVLYKHFILTMDKVVDSPYSVLLTITSESQQLVAGHAFLLRSLYER